MIQLLDLNGIISSVEQNLAEWYSMCAWCSADDDESLKFEGLMLRVTLASMVAFQTNKKVLTFFFLFSFFCLGDFCDQPWATETSREHLVSVLQEM